MRNALFHFSSAATLLLLFWQRARAFVVPIQRKQGSLSKRIFQNKNEPLAMASIASSTALPRITEKHMKELVEKNYVIIPDFLPEDLQEALRSDVSNLRNMEAFKVAKIGQDATNTLNRQIREAQTCFIGGKRDIPDSEARSKLISVLEQTGQDLSENPILKSPKLDDNLSELLYAYYPQGGFYRRHRDAIPGSASVLRTYSLLLYLNKDWEEKDAGYLRMHMDSGGDELPDGEEPDYLDVPPKGGTLVLFSSDKVPHEVLDTNSERLAIVGWYNKELTTSDLSELGVNPMRLGMLAVAAGLVTFGVVSLLAS